MTTIGTAQVPVPSSDLNMIIDIEFHIVSENIPILLSNEEMFENGLDKNSQEHTGSLKHIKSPVHFENYFLIHQ